MAKTVKSDKPRIAVIGAGIMADYVHLPSLKHLSKIGRCSLVAISDLNSQLAVNACKKFGIPKAYTDFHEMLRVEKPDGVVVLVPIKACLPVAGAVLKKGYPVLMEKTPGTHSKECRDLIQAAKQGKAPNMVAFNRRFCPVIVQAKLEALKRGAVKGASGRMYRKNRKEDVFFKYTGIHSLDALRFLAGDMVRVETDKRIIAKGEEHTFTLFIEYASGSSGTLMIRPQAGIQLDRFDVFSKNTLVQIRTAGAGSSLDAPGSCTVYEDNKIVKIPDAFKPYQNFEGDLRIAAEAGFYGENAAFVSALNGQQPFAPTLQQSLQSMEIAEAVQDGKNWKC